LGYDTGRPYIRRVAPTPNASGVAITSLISVIFSERMNTSTLTSDYIGIYADPLVELNNGAYSYNDGLNMLTIDPSGSLDVNSRYSVVVSGTVQDYSGNSMGMDVWWNFWTTQPSGYAYSSGVQAQPLGHTLDGYLDVLSTDPKCYTTNTTTDDISPIYIYLNDKCAIGNRNYFGNASGINPATFGTAFFEVPSTTLSNYISITNNEVLGDPNIVHTAPTYTIQSSGTILRIDGYGWVNNNEYIVTVKAGLPGLTTNPLQSDYNFVFTSTYSPLYMGYNVIRLNIGPMLQMAMAYVPDDTINRFIYESSKHADNIFPYSIDSSDIPWYVKEFVTYQTKLNALYSAIMLFAASGAGIKKTLADLTVEIDARGLMPALLPILDDYRKLRDYYLELVEAGSDSGPQPVWVTRAQSDSRRPITDESWRRLPMRDVRSDSNIPVETKIKWWYTKDITNTQYITDSRYLVEGRYVSN